MNEKGYLAFDKTQFLCGNCMKKVKIQESKMKLEGIETNRCVFCNNWLAVKMDKMYFQIGKILDTVQSKEVERGTMIGNSLICFSPGTKFSHSVLKFLSYSAIEEVRSFNPYNPMYNSSLLLVNNIDGRRNYVGFLTWWTKKFKSCLAQIFIDEKWRRRGYAEALVRHWIKDVGIKNQKKFLVESPNDMTKNLLVKMGHAEFRDGNFIEINCETVMYP